MSGTVVGCASSAIGDLELDDGQLASEGNASTSDAGATSDDEEDPAPVVTKKDASVKDATVTAEVKDAAVADAGKADAGKADAGNTTTVKDAGSTTVADAGSTTTLKDAGTTTVKDAGSTATPTTPTTPAGECSKDSDCTQSCVPVGLFQCCSNHKCGCTWAPGTYCF